MNWLLKQLIKPVGKNVSVATLSRLPPQNIVELQKKKGKITILLYTKI
jgi:hypothetical protein